MSWSARRYKNKPGRNKHHLTPKSRGGMDADWNLLLIKIERHNEWHKLFGLMNLAEIISLLTRLQRFKERQRDTGKSIAISRTNSAARKAHPQAA